MRLLITAIALITLATQAVAQGPVTPRNWRNHPRIREVRAIVTDIEDHPGRLGERSDSADCGRGYITIVAHLFTDSAGRVRKYTREGGSDDSAGEETFYYDSLSALRFTFATVGAVNGTERADRYYYDSQGSLLYHVARTRKGPGYFGWGGTPVFDPAADFKALCGLASQ